ncbi:MAG: hypothetical protein HUU47_00985 [Bacteroidetes bacterium]|nr:hypothetical protein [Bacteroidota bacterium]
MKSLNKNNTNYKNMIVHIENELDCPLEFHWEYQTIKGNEMLYAAKIHSKSRSVIYGNFVSFHNGPFVRPTKLKLVSWNDRKTFLPWELINKEANGDFNDCNGKKVNFEVTEKDKDIIILKFYN